MDTMNAYFRKQAAIANGNKTKELDWDKAKSIIENSDPYKVTAYLSGDFGNTFGIIYESGEYKDGTDGILYTSSIWATPMLLLEFETEEETEEIEIPCWKFGDDQDPTQAWPNLRKEELK